MALIFSASSDTHSYVHSSRLIAPLLHWLFHNCRRHGWTRSCFSSANAHTSRIRRAGAAAWRALRKPGKTIRARELAHGTPRLLLAPLARRATNFIIVVATRDAGVQDVFIDTVVGAAGLPRSGSWPLAENCDRNHEPRFVAVVLVTSPVCCSAEILKPPLVAFCRFVSRPRPRPRPRKLRPFLIWPLLALVAGPIWPAAPRPCAGRSARAARPQRRHCGGARHID